MTLSNRSEFAMHVLQLMNLKNTKVFIITFSFLFSSCFFCCSTLITFGLLNSNSHAHVDVDTVLLLAKRARDLEKEKKEKNITDMFSLGKKSFDRCH